MMINHETQMINNQSLAKFNDLVHLRETLTIFESELRVSTSSEFLVQRQAALVLACGK